MKSALPMTDKMMELIAQRFRILGEPFRLRLLQVLQAGERSVGELVAELDGNQPNVSKHLHILHDGGLVGRRRDGTSILYSIADPMVFELCALVCRRETQKSLRGYEELSGLKGARRSR